MNDDGTEDPGPPPVLADPVSGLVTGTRYDSEQVTVRVAEPPQPDIAQVRKVMAEMLDEDSELDLSLVVSPPVNGTAAPQPPQGAAASAATPPFGIPAQQSASPEAAPAQAPTPESAVPAGPTPGSSAPAGPAPATPTLVTPRRVEKVRRVPRRFALGRLRQGLPRGLPRGLPQRFRRTPKPVPGRVRKSSAADIAIIMILLFVTAVVAIVLLASLLDTLSSLFS
jgi:hypothetical protein